MNDNSAFFWRDIIRSCVIERETKDSGNGFYIARWECWDESASELHVVNAISQGRRIEIEMKVLEPRSNAAKSG
jgi:hypothetical protein